MFPPNARFIASDILITGTFLALRNHLWEVAVQSHMLRPVDTKPNGKCFALYLPTG
jgi:hypothetical protein